MCVKFGVHLENFHSYTLKRYWLCVPAGEGGEAKLVGSNVL